jgi:predicted transcriptional regulator
MAVASSYKILGDTELEVRQLVWAWGSATVRDIHATLYARRGLAYTP